MFARSQSNRPRRFRRGTLTLLTLALVVSTSAVAEDQPVFTAGKDGQRVTVSLGKQIVLRYRFGDVPFKPYVEQLYTPSGVNVLRDSPFDHKHHHALMFAVAVDGINFWEEKEGCGRQVHRTASADSGGGTAVVSASREDGRSWGGLTESVDWLGPKSEKPLLRETRLVEAVSVKGSKATLVTWQSRLSLPPGKESAVITGADYFGLGIRFPQSMDKDGHFVNADGKKGVADTNAARSRWCAYIARADGRLVTVAMFDHPRNLRQPATWFTMETPFAYLCATLKLKTDPVTITPNEPLVLCYGVAAWDGSVEPAEIDGLYKRWVELPVKAPSTAPGAKLPAKQP